MAATADAEGDLRHRQAEPGQMRIEHPGIMVLAGVQQHRAQRQVASGQGVPEGSELGQVGAGGGDQVEFHIKQPGGFAPEPLPGPRPGR
jgi:hypothetical protein